MALEPRTVSAQDEENPELASMSRRFWVSALLTLPVFVTAMAEMIPGQPVQRALGPQLVTWMQLVLATREPSRYGEELRRWVAYGASPRGTIALDRCARAHAWLAGRDYVTPEDVHAIAADVLRHRVLLSYEAEAEGVNSDRVVATLLERVPLP